MKSLEDYLREAREIIASIDVAEAAALDGALFVDVREPEEAAAIAGAADALHIPRGRLESRADPASASAEPRLTAARGGEQPVVVYCNGGGRGVLATKTLTEMGYDARLLEGGARAWNAAQQAQRDE